MEIFVQVRDPLLPQIVCEEKSFLLVYKPPRMHSAPQNKSSGESIFDWCAASFSEIRTPMGRKAGEGGLFHRLDYETQGLLLLARNKACMDSLLRQQAEGKIIKEYSAIVSEKTVSLPGFPLEKPLEKLPEGRKFKLKSGFRPYGKGRKTVRPLPGGSYLTEVFETNPLTGAFYSLKIRIFKGFRHQIRSHLAWISTPIINDLLYEGLPHGKGFLALRACSLIFNDPDTQAELKYSIPSLDLKET